MRHRERFGAGLVDSARKLWEIVSNIVLFTRKGTRAPEVCQPRGSTFSEELLWRLCEDFVQRQKLARLFPCHGYFLLILSSDSANLTRMHGVCFLVRRGGLFLDKRVLEKQDFSNLFMRW